MKKILPILIFALFICPGLVSAKHDYHEKYYQEKWCDAQKGRSEYVLPDRTRADCITFSHAVEVDFANKFYEAIGQSLYYSLQTGKRAGIVLIIEKERERKYYYRLNSTIVHFDLPIDTLAVGAGAVPRSEWFVGGEVPTK